MEILVRNDPAGLEEGRWAMRAFLARCRVGERALYRTDVVFEELLLNTIRHAYTDSGEHWIKVSVAVDRSRITLQIDDDGRPFDPSRRPAQPLPRSIEEASVGGLGLLLVERMSALIQYRRENGRNLVTVVIPDAQVID